MGNEEKREEALAHQIADSIKEIQYGSVQIIIQDSKVVQIEKTEKIRVNNQPKSQRDAEGR